jgi:hypothetical protein
MKLIFAVLLVIVASCSFKKSQLENQTLKGHEELYSEPEEPKLQGLDEFEKRIIIASTNDVHGNYKSDSYKFKDSHNKGELEINIGQKDVINNYFSILREQFKNIVLVDSGDIFSEADKMSSVREFYEQAKYDAVTVGLRDFNLKVPSKLGSNTKLFQDFAKSSSVPLLLSNLYELKTARTVEWEGSKPYIIKDFDGVKVGIIGLIPDDIVAQTPVHNRVGLFVENMLQSTLRHARLLRSLGADMIVVLTHQGLDCSTELSEKTGLPPSKVNFEPMKSDVCNLKSPLGIYLERLPHNLVDVVIGGRTHQKMANYVNGTLVMSGYSDAKSFSYAEFVINSKTKKIVPEKTVVHQPVMFCQQFFKETNDCFFEDKTVDHKGRIPAKFLGKPIGQQLTAGIQNKKVTYSHNLKEISKRLVHYKADLSYVPETSGETQLFIMNIKGKDLVRVLEEEYNHDRKDNWQPSPFLMKDDELTVSIAGLDLDVNRTYRVLTDLESIQKHKVLIKQVASYDSEAIMSSSWSSGEEDTVSVQLAAEMR